MIRRILASLLLLVVGPVTAQNDPDPQPTGRPEVIVVIGAAGEPEFAEGFAAAGRTWVEACQRAQVDCIVIANESSAEDAPAARDRLHAAIAEVSASVHPLWLVYIGHGTWDGREARLNLPGEDVGATELRDWLQNLPRPLVFVHGGSASGPFLPLLSGPHRIVITATESGDEVNYARFGERFAEAVADAAADLDQDGQTSVLEAFLRASRDTQLFYSEAGRMATEHALIDDNGDRRGTPSDWFQGTRVVKRATDDAKPDGDVAREMALVESPAERRLTVEQRERREELEDELEELRSRKSELPEAEYLDGLERIFRQLGAIYESVEDS